MQIRKIFSLILIIISICVSSSQTIPRQNVNFGLLTFQKAMGQLATGVSWELREALTLPEATTEYPCSPGSLQERAVPAWLSNHESEIMQAESKWGINRLVLLLVQ